MTTYILGNDNPIFITDSTGTVSLAPGLPIVGLDAPSLAVLPALVGVDDAVYVTTLTALAGFATLAPALFTDGDVFYVPIAVPSAVGLITALVPGDDTVSAPAIIRGAVTLLPALVGDGDSFGASTIAVIIPASQTLSPARIADGETFYAPRMGQDRFLRPALVPSDDFFWPPYNIDTVKLPHEQKLRAPLVPGPDTIYPPFFPRTPLVYVDQDIIYAVITQAEYPLRPALVPSDDTIKNPFLVTVAQPGLVSDADAIYRPGITLFLVPQLVAKDDAIPAADVGWQVIADFTTDNDTIYDISVQAYNELLPEVWLDEETIDTYPFFLQSLTGGIPMPKPIGLTGSISYPRRLTGSIAPRRQLTGSISPRIGKARR